MSVSYISNLYECEVEDDNVTHKNTHQSNHIAKAILEEQDQYRLKDYSKGLGDPEWERLRA